MNKILEIVLLAIGVAAIVVISYWLGQQAYSWMPPAATAEARHVDDLFSFLVALGVFVFLTVIGTIVYSIITCRTTKNDYTEGHPARGNGKLEFLWTAIPTVLVLWIAYQSYSIYQQLDIEGLGTIMDSSASLASQPALATTVIQPTSQPIEEIEVLAKQWVWTFRYPQKKIATGELHLPKNRRVRLVFQSEDVIHGFYVPEFRFKQDIIPNHTLDFTFTPLREGKYKLHDSQFSGTYFALMEADVYVDSPEAYSQWLKSTNGNTMKLNLAAAEHAQKPQQLIKSNWHAVEPYLPLVATEVKSKN
ncbi:cytochrome c oxidase subunit II [Pleurocapsales cyanobacterium LEGE 06147]|nr:cytochrome c oxidase subunit II [Pleurocapsales cyanobacterium LEGE 06147]